MKEVSEIIKAVEVHKNLRPCSNCPYDSPKRGKCVDKLFEDILQVLNGMVDDGK